MANIKELQKQVETFRDERDWKQFHSEKDLAIALSIEVGELMEHLRYKTKEQLDAYFADPKNKQEFGYELADCLYHLLAFASVMGIELEAAFAEKMALLEKKYPAALAKGKNHKWTRYQEHEKP
ncbi:nucleotide pyrophosphohydrolase [Candidatus Woesearchaeota archaeon CG_4_10_14_0_8_um_filter_47_5]|nr:MAG: nucleotide pyrophosphohydrolase [Candidatus Woesearchaeota archaeon CG_4_10_14_0_8_um_filter_47_5]